MRELHIQQAGEREFIESSERTRSEEALTELNAQLQILQHITETVHSTLDLKKIFSQITDAFVHSMDYTTAFFVALNDEKKHFEIKALSTKKRLLHQINKILGFSLRNLSFLADPKLNIIVNSVMNGKLMIVKTLAEIAYPVISKKKCSALQKIGRTKNYIIAPLKVEKEVVGAVFISSSHEEISEEELKVIKSFALAASNAIKNASLYMQAKQAEMALKSSEERLRILFEFAPDAYYLNDLKGNFVDGNKAAEEITGYKREELIGKSFLKLKLLPPEQIPKATSLLAKNILGKPTGPSEFILNQKDGKQVPVEIRTFPVKIKDKTLVLGIARDITERKQAEEKIKKSLKEKEVLLKEIHHRVKNNLQVISSLLKLQSEYIKDKQALQMFKESQNRVRSMALIHEKLYQSKDLANIDLKGYINDLVFKLFRSYEANPDKIALRTDVEEVTFGVDTAIPCGLIINELVSNCLEHAFPQGRKGEVKVSLHSANKNEIELKVSDNGVGLADDFDFRKTKSLGLQLVTILAEDQLDGKIELNGTGGAEFKIKFKKEK